MKPPPYLLKSMIRVLSVSPCVITKAEYKAAIDLCDGMLYVQVYYVYDTGYDT